MGGSGWLQLRVGDGYPLDPCGEFNGKFHFFAMALAFDDLAAAPLGVPYPLADGQKVLLVDEVAKIGGCLGGLRTFVPIVMDTLGRRRILAFGPGWADALARAFETTVDLVAGLYEVGGDFA